MSEVIVNPAPDLAERIEDAWHRERRAFTGLLPTLMTSHRGQYVAVHGGNVVVSGPDKLAVARQAYDRVGYVPIYVGRVTDAAEPPVRIPSPRSVR